MSTTHTKPELDWACISRDIYKKFGEGHKVIDTVISSTFENGDWMVNGIGMNCEEMTLNVTIKPLAIPSARMVMITTNLLPK